MSKREAKFNDIVRKLRKELFGKGPEFIQTVFIRNMAVTTLKGNLSATEKFLASTEDGVEVVRLARTKLVQDYYSSGHVPDGLEDLIGSKLVRLFSDFHVKDDIAVSVFVFEDDIEK